jgi:hypothetical protein
LTADVRPTHLTGLSPRSRDTLVTRFTPFTTHGQQSACSQGRSTTGSCSDTFPSDFLPSQWSGEGTTGVSTNAVSSHPLSHWEGTVGRVAVQEFMAALFALRRSNPLDPARFQLAFKVYDVDGDGRVSKNDLLETLCTSRHPASRGDTRSQCSVCDLFTLRLTRCSGGTPHSMLW